MNNDHINKNLQDNKNRISGLYSDQIKKSKGEGSKGGKVIGHTKSGKAVYETHNSTVHQDFTQADHEDAVKIHRDKKKKIDKEPAAQGFHENQAQQHERFAKQENKKSLAAEKEKIDSGTFDSVDPSKLKAFHTGRTAGGTGARDSAEDRSSKGAAEEHRIEKSKGEGSKGGKVIGHTKSGKPVYESKGADKYKDFTKEDHLDAVRLHRKEQKQYADERPKAPGFDNGKPTSDAQKMVSHHGSMLMRHEDASKEMGGFGIGNQNAKKTGEKADKEEPIHSDNNIAIHQNAKQIAKHAGISNDEYKKLHPDTKKELLTKMKISNDHEKRSKGKDGEAKDDAKDAADQEQNERARNVATDKNSSEEARSKAKAFLDAKRDHSNKSFEDAHDEDYKHKVGDAVKVQHGITDSIRKQGQTGTVVHSQDDQAHVRFVDGNLGKYRHNALMKEKKSIKKSDYKEGQEGRDFHIEANLDIIKSHQSEINKQIVDTFSKNHVKNRNDHWAQTDMSKKNEEVAAKYHADKKK